MDSEQQLYKETELLYCVTDTILTDRHVVLYYIQLLPSKDLDISAWVNLVYSVTRSSAGLVVQVVTHYKHAVITETT